MLGSDGVGGVLPSGGGGPAGTSGRLTLGEGEGEGDLEGGGVLIMRVIAEALNVNGQKALTPTFEFILYPGL